MTDDRDSWIRALAVLADTGLPVRTRTLVPADVIAADGSFKRVDRAHRHRIEIVSDSDVMWSGLKRPARTAIRKAEKAGVTVRDARDEADLRAFFELQLAVRKQKYRLLAQPFEFFREIWGAFMAQGHGTLRLAEHEGRIIAGTLFLEWDGAWFYKFNASSIDSVQLRPNDLLIWTSMKAAAEREVNAICLGLTDWSQDGLVRFKEKYARDASVITTLAAGEPVGSMSAGKRIVGVAARIATAPRMPDAVTEEVGARLYRTFA